MLLDTDKNRIAHMLRATEQMLEYSSACTQEDAECQPPLQHLFLRNFEILGEAASRISPELRKAHPEIPWRDIIDMRNRLIHAYFDIDMNIVWKTIQDALPETLEKLKAIRDSDGTV
jgi:uncharacterized protein with HEPN domain